MSVGELPWTPVEPGTADGIAGPLAVVAGRRCTQREGLDREERERASWFLLRHGALLAYDHDGFAPLCEASPAYVPAPREDVGIERMLVRYVTQRWPGDGVSPDERLPRGLALLDARRADDALLELQAFDRDIAELERRKEETEDEAQREAWSREVARLGPLRARLHHALREWRERGGETPWDG